MIRQFYLPGEKNLGLDLLSYSGRKIRRVANKMH